MKTFHFAFDVKASNVIIAGIILWILSMLFIFRGMMADENVAIRALETHGFSNIIITDHSYFFIGFRGGAAESAARFTATATNPVGKEVTIFVDVGYPFMGATLRAQ